MAKQENEIDLRTLGYVTERETAEIFDVCVGTLRNWRARGVGPPYTRVQRNVIVYPIGALKKHLERRTVKPTAAA